MEITIGFPVYNVENSIRKSLLSALEQDFGLEYEILIAVVPSSTLFKSKSMDLVFKILKRRPEKAMTGRFFRLAGFYRYFLGHFVAGTYAKLFTQKARRELYS